MPIALAAILLALGVSLPVHANPFEEQAQRYTAMLGSPDPNVRAGAAEALGFLRAYSAEADLVQRLSDPAPQVRREAAMALAWCGGRETVDPLLETLDDDDWTVSQAAWCALTNLTGMEFPFDALADPNAAAWREWWENARSRPVPREVSALLEGPPNLALACDVTASTTYRGPPGVLTDGQVDGAYWQTKNVPFPQSCTVDLGQPQELGQVIIHQYSDAFVMTDYEVLTSVDGESFRSLGRRTERTPARLQVSLNGQAARYLRIVSYASVNPTYPTTFREIEILPPSLRELERGLRALGALAAGETGSDPIIQTLGPLRPQPGPADSPRGHAIQAGLRSLGRLRDPGSLPWVSSWLWDEEWGRFAARALGEMEDDRAAPALMAAYPLYAKGLNQEIPPRAPRQDRPGFENRDRMYETPFHIIEALSRLPLEQAGDRAALRRLAPLLLANLPEDFDGMMLYEPEAGQRLTAHLLERAGARRQAIEVALSYLLDGDVGDSDLASALRSPEQAATWLPALCRETSDVPRLVQLLEHQNGWVRINACKALAFIGDERAIEPIARMLDETPSEASYGVSGRFLDEEFNDPAPRVREAFATSLGLLGAPSHAPLLEHVCTDEGSALEVRLAAARALGELGAIAELRRVATAHPYHTVRLAARESLWRRGESWEPYSGGIASEKPQPDGRAEGYVFIKGDNVLPNFFQNDHWRQAYVTTDTGPVYRPGRNLWVLSPAGEARPLTQFEDGYVGECEVSWDARRVVFTRRGEDDPWWHVFEIGADGSGLRQLTFGPYHDVGPAYLPDGRIVFASSRGGMRDEYHGYLCTALHVMGPDGGDIHPIAINAGRDNEPSILPDGRIVFARLEVFYSRLKTELTIHAVDPDGTRDVVLYGPERREFWERLDVGPRGDDYAAQTPAMHRVLRVSQPQGLPGGDIVCASQGGLVLLGRERGDERIIPHDDQLAFTTPYPLADGSLLCAATEKAPEREGVDLGIFRVDPGSGELELLYNDPTTADYEARPLLPRDRPPVLASGPRSDEFTGEFVCMSVHNTQEPGVVERGRFVRVIEGQPMPGRHSTHTNPGEVWQNHGGTLARVLATAPLAADGSFRVEVPADRLLHFQVLDSDRRVIANQLTWIYVRPGERRTCIGCHEEPDTSPGVSEPRAARETPIECLPTGEEFRYRAKVWLKGDLPPQADERTRTARATNLHAR
jgi:HEAT repeat protein